MKPRIKLAESTLSSGGTVTLYEHDGAFSISFSGQELMHSKACASEQLLGKLGVAGLDPNGGGRVLIGGMGLGFTLQSVLESSGPSTEVILAELVPEVIEWNRDQLKGLNGHCLDDPRVEVRMEDVAEIIRGAEPESYDTILLDVDNGPVAMVSAKNVSLYSNAGLRQVKAALKAGGRAVFWSAGPDKNFQARLENAGFRVEAVPAKVHEGAKRAAYLLYVADRS